MHANWDSGHPNNEAMVSIKAAQENTEVIDEHAK